MARINGINSDYVLQGDQIIEIDPKPANLELKLFICPHDQNNALQAENSVCTGEDSACPNPGAKSGHALVHLSQNGGIRLVTDGGTELQLHQNSGPDAGVIALRPAGAKVHLEGALELEAGGRTLTITPSGAGVTIASGGAQVRMLPNGNLDLITQGNSGTVTVQGNLVVSGTLTRQGQQI